MTNMHRRPPITRRRVALLGAALACLAVAVPAATPAPDAKARRVTFTLGGKGLGNWSIDWPKEKGQLALRYTWTGRFTFNVPARVLKNAGRVKFKVRSKGTLRGNWVGVLTGTVVEGFAEGPYRCEYKGSSATAPVIAELSNAKTRGRLLVTLRAVRGSFFSSSGTGASINCISAYGQSAPPHFDPGWLFRDTYSDRGKLTRDTAFIGFPSKALPRGTVKTTFPNEVGARDSNFTGNVRWKNRGVVTVKTR
jgi:hypothetical protein